MAPRIREGDQGANKKGIKAFSPRRRKERKVKQEIRTCLLLLSGLRVFAVKILGELVNKEMYWPRTNTETKDLIRAGSVSDGKRKISIGHGQMVRKNPFPSFSRMRKSIFTARQEWTPAYARVTKAIIRREIRAGSVSDGR